MVEIKLEAVSWLVIAAVVAVRRFDLTDVDAQPTTDRRAESLKQAKFNIINLSCARYTVGSNDTRRKKKRAEKFCNR